MVQIIMELAIEEITQILVLTLVQCLAHMETTVITAVMLVLVGMWIMVRLVLEHALTAIILQLAQERATEQQMTLAIMLVVVLMEIIVILVVGVGIFQMLIAPVVLRQLIIKQLIVEVHILSLVLDQLAVPMARIQILDL